MTAGYWLTRQPGHAAGRSVSHCRTSTQSFTDSPEPWTTRCSSSAQDLAQVSVFGQAGVSVSSQAYADHAFPLWQLMGCVSTNIVKFVSSEMHVNAVFVKLFVQPRTELVVSITERTALYRNDPLLLLSYSNLAYGVHRHHKDCSVTTGSPGRRPPRLPHSSWARMACHLKVSTSVLKNWFRTFFRTLAVILFQIFVSSLRLLSTRSNRFAIKNVTIWNWTRPRAAVHNQQ